MLCVVAATLGVHGIASSKELKQGWNGDVQLGGLATFSDLNSAAITALSSLTYGSVSWEHELEAKYYRSSSESVESVRDENDELARDADGNEIKRTVSYLKNDRRYLSAESRWFFTSKLYLFGVGDLDVNKPANLNESSRAVGGVGYKVYENKKNFLRAGVGLGKKRTVKRSGSREEGSISYLTVAFKRELGEKLVLSMNWDSDFSSDNRYSEAQVTFAFKIRDPLSLQLQYEARFNSTPLDPLNTFDDGYVGEISLNLAFDIF